MEKVLKQVQEAIIVLQLQSGCSKRGWPVSIVISSSCTVEEDSPQNGANYIQGRSSDSSIYLISNARICLQGNSKSYKANSQYWPSICMSICYSIIPTLTNTVLDPQYWKRKQTENPFPDKLATQEKTETTYNKYK